ncbi:EmrB/QacA family drug resistance transporter [Terrihabitans soli]|uniref:EmrB/QacA family drug resistance transporter n=1 Tax=Terrihabitans soli TaxID=708113 RepID=A0A6S6QI40_9HYPH|nr:DHA2 family efflux MFS transporter permease subunit [Terrihabitans soli]BCJ90893.1 EmrB/QacA family drug resistance transporter [Terrihabitans soli]
MAISPEILKVRPVIVACAMMATIMQALDTTIANVALPYMQGSLTATQDQINWVLTSYIVAAAIMTPPVGWLASRFGRKNIFVICVTGFTAASMLCGIATSLEEMVIFRMLQGVFGAALVPLSQSVMFDLYPEEQRGSAMAMWGMGVMLGPILGPTLGGWLTETYNWRWVFFVNLPFGILAAIGFLWALPAAQKVTTMKFDWFGFGMLSLGIGALQMMLDRGEQVEWFDSGEIWIYTALAVIGFYVFLVHTFTAKKPFIDPSLLTDRNLSTSLIMMFVVGIVLLATLALLTPYLQGLMGYPVVTAGLVLGPRGVGTMIAMMVVGRLVQRYDARYLMLFGFVLTAIALYEMSGFTPDVSQFTLIWTGMVQGFGLGFLFVPIQTIAFATLPAHQRTDGAALISLVRNIGSAVGISVVTFLLIRNTSIVHSDLSQFVSPFSYAVQSLSGTVMDASTMTGKAILNQVVGKQASIIAYADDFWLMMWIAIAAMPVVFIMKRPPRIGGGAAHAAMD